MYGLIGRPLGHSFSADFFNNKFLTENINEEYRLFPLESIDELPDLLERYPELKGLNVTIPYKRDVIPFLDEISDEAKVIGAVNVIKIVRSAKGVSLKGFNSDAVGFRDSILPLLKPFMKNALVLGTGGASKAVIFVLKSLGINVVSVSRKNNGVSISYDDITQDLLNSHHIIVNTTPLGMWPNIDETPNIPYTFLSSSHLLFDLVYNPTVTQFMKYGLMKGATVKNGLEMLYGQAIEAWRIWNT